MTRALLLLSTIVGLCMLLTQRADALYEFCPTDVRISPGINAEPSASYALELAALGPRTVSATIAFDTSAGWFTVDVPQTALVKKDRRFSGPTSEFTMRDWVSPMFYIRFPQPVSLRHRWVYRATASGDQFGWASQGSVECRPYTDFNGLQLPGPKFVFTTKDVDDFNPIPPSNATVLIPKASAALASAPCTTPFAQAAPTTMTKPNDLTPVRMPLTAVVEVALKPDGTLADAWVWGPSSDQVFDAARLDEVKKYSFKPATAYCATVPSFNFLVFHYLIQ